MTIVTGLAKTQLNVNQADAHAYLRARRNYGSIAFYLYLSSVVCNACENTVATYHVYIDLFLNAVNKRWIVIIRCRFWVGEYENYLFYVTRDWLFYRFLSFPWTVLLEHWKIIHLNAESCKCYIRFIDIPFWR